MQARAVTRLLLCPVGERASAAILRGRRFCAAPLCKSHGGNGEGAKSPKRVLFNPLTPTLPPRGEGARRAGCDAFYQ